MKSELLAVCDTYKLSIIHFHTHFSSRESRGAATLGGLEIPHSAQQPLIVLEIINHTILK